MRLGILLAHQLASLTAAADPKPGVVLVHVAEDDGAAAHELAALVERHGELADPKIRVASPDPSLSRLAAARGACSTQVLGVFWLDAQRRDEWRLYALPCATMRPLVREIVVTAGAEQASIEASWLITRSSAAAISQPDAIAMAEAETDAIDDPPAPTEPPPTEPVARPDPVARSPTRTEARVQVGLGYAGEVLGRSIPWRSGVFGAAAWMPRKHLRVGAWYQFLAPGRLDEPAGFAVWHHGVAITLAGVAPLGRRVAIELRGGPELELLRWRSRALGRGRLRPIPRVGADATVQIVLAGRPTRRLTLDVGVGVAVALVDVDFVTCEAGDAAGGETTCAGDTRRVAADSWRVRPRARGGLSVQF